MPLFKPVGGFMGEVASKTEGESLPFPCRVYASGLQVLLEELHHLPEDALEDVRCDEVIRAFPVEIDRHGLRGLVYVSFLTEDSLHLGSQFPPFPYRQVDEAPGIVARDV